jgi:predicted nucleic acid-binding protein
MKFMTVAITFVFIAICLVEIVLITKEVRRTSTNTLSKTEASELPSETQVLSEQLAVTSRKLEEAQREIQGINVLWNKSLQVEQRLRADLEIAKVQLTYLAQSLLKAKAGGTQTAYWTEGESENRELRAFKTTSELVQKDFM